MQQQCRINYCCRSFNEQDRNTHSHWSCGFMQNFEVWKVEQLSVMKEHRAGTRKMASVWGKSRGSPSPAAGENLPAGRNGKIQSCLCSSAWLEERGEQQTCVCCAEGWPGVWFIPSSGWKTSRPSFRSQRASRGLEQRCQSGLKQDWFESTSLKY